MVSLASGGMDIWQIRTTKSSLHSEETIKFTALDGQTGLWPPVLPSRKARDLIDEIIRITSIKDMPPDTYEFSEFESLRFERARFLAALTT